MMLTFNCRTFRKNFMMLCFDCDTIGMYWNVLKCIGKCNQTGVYLLIVVLLKYIEKMMFTF